MSVSLLAHPRHCPARKGRVDVPAARVTKGIRAATSDRMSTLRYPLTGTVTAGGVMGELSLIARICLPLILALVGNLATNTVQVNAPWWPVVCWSTVAILTGLWLVADRRMHPRRRADEPDLVKVAIRLAGLVVEGWDRAEGGVQNPESMLVRWHLTGRTRLADQWANITGVDLELPTVPSTGTVPEIAATYRQIPSGRLVILGEPGAGKTVTATRCALDLIADRKPGDRVPLVIDIRTWEPHVHLSDWLVEELEREHQFLTEIGLTGRSLATELVGAKHILPILDGFDGMPADRQSDALRRLSELKKWPLILTSRRSEFQAAVQSSAVLRAAAVIELDELALDDLEEYFQHDGTDWGAVLDALRARPENPASEQLRQVLATPLMLYLTRTRYSNAKNADPAELLDMERFPSRRALEQHLIAQFIPAIYTPRDKRVDHWRAAQAHRYLSFIGREMNRTGNGSRRLLDIGATRHWPLNIVVVASFAGLTVGLPCGFLLGLIYGGTAGKLIGLSIWLGFTTRYVAKRTLPWNSGARYDDDLDLGSTGAKNATGKRTLAERVLELPPMARVGVIFPVAALIPGGLGWIIIDPAFGIIFWLAAYVITTYMGPWLLIAKLWLPLRGHAPWRLRKFLEDACRRGVLRKVGTEYQFRHTLLLSHVARSRTIGTQPDTSRGNCVARRRIVAADGNPEPGADRRSFRGRGEVDYNLQIDGRGVRYSEDSGEFQVSWDQITDMQFESSSGRNVFSLNVDARNVDEAAVGNLANAVWRPRDARLCLVSFESLREGTASEVIAALEKFGGNRLTQNNLETPDALLFYAKVPYLRFARARVVMAIFTTIAVTLLLGYQQGDLIERSAWWWFTLPVSLFLALAVFGLICEIFRPIERYRLRVSPRGLGVEVATMHRGFQDPDHDREGIHWSRVTAIERVTLDGRDLLVMQTHPDLRYLRRARRLPTWEPALGEYAVRVCPLDYFVEDPDVVLRLIAEYRQRYNDESPFTEVTHSSQPDAVD